MGAAIAIKIGNPALALPLALASHFVLDLLPHWNPHLNREIKKYGRVTRRTTIIIIADVVASLVAGFYIASTALPNRELFITVLLGAFFAVLPDVVEAPYFFFRWKNPLIIKLAKFQSSLQVNVPFLPGLVSQILIISAAFWWALD